MEGARELKMRFGKTYGKRMRVEGEREVKRREEKEEEEEWKEASTAGAGVWVVIFHYFSTFGWVNFVIFTNIVMKFFTFKNYLEVLVVPSRVWGTAL